MDPTPEKRRAIAKWIIGIAASCILLFLGVQNIGAVADVISQGIGLIMPLLTGAAIAVILNVPMRFFEAYIWTTTQKPILRKLRRPISFLLALVIIIAAVASVIGLVIPELVNALVIVAQGIIDLFNQLNAMSEAELEALPFGSILLSIDWNQFTVSIQNWLKNEGGAIFNFAFGTVTSLINAVVNFFVCFVFAVYILFNKEKLKNQSCRLVRAWLPKGFGEWVLHAASVSNVTFRNFISGQSLEAVILGSLCTVGMLILRIPYAPMVGALVGATALIPVVGAFIGTVIGAFMILTVAPFKAVIFVIFLLILQQIEGNLIYPKVMGHRVNLPGMWIFAAVTVGGSISGPIGMLLSVPISSIAYTLVKEATQNRERKLAKKQKQ